MKTSNNNNTIIMSLALVSIKNIEHEVYALINNTKNNRSIKIAIMNNGTSYPNEVEMHICEDVDTINEINMMRICEAFINKLDESLKNLELSALNVLKQIHDMLNSNGIEDMVLTKNNDNSVCRITKRIFGNNGEFKLIIELQTATRNLMMQLMNISNHTVVDKVDFSKLYTLNDINNVFGNILSTYERYYSMTR